MYIKICSYYVLIICRKGMYSGRHHKMSSRNFHSSLTFVHFLCTKNSSLNMLQMLSYLHFVLFWHVATIHGCMFHYFFGYSDLQFSNGSHFAIFIWFVLLLTYIIRETSYLLWIFTCAPTTYASYFFESLWLLLVNNRDFCTFLWFAVDSSLKLVIQTSSFV